MALRVVKHFRAMQHAPRFRIKRANIKPGNAGMRNGPGTHRARFQRHIKIATHQPVLPKRCAGRAQGDDLRMSRGILSQTRMIATAPDNLPLLHHNRPHRNLAARSGGLGLCQGFLHEGRELHWVPLTRVID